MENSKAKDVLRARTLFKTSDGSYFFYDHIEGVLGTIVSDGARKGLFFRTDSTAATLARQFHREEYYGVPDTERLYFPMSEAEWNDRLCRMITDVERTLINISI